jgi:hypothetical protein
VTVPDWSSYLSWQLLRAGTAIPYDATVGSLPLTSTAKVARPWMLTSPAASIDDGAIASL